MIRKPKNTRTDRHSSRNAFDRFYRSFPAEFWLVSGICVVGLDWFLHPASLFSAFLMLVATIAGGFVLLATNPRFSRLVTNFGRQYGKNGAWSALLSLLVAITVFNYATSPSSALILTDGGADVLKGLVPNGTAIIGTVITVFRALFFIGFMWALYRAYDKYTQQAELIDVIQTPIILLMVVGVIDTAAGIFLKASP